MRTLENNIHIYNFLNHVRNNPFPHNQESCGTGKDLWTSDMWTVEVLKCLYYGDSYDEFIEPKLLVNNKFDVERIKKDAEIKRATYANLQKIQVDSDYLLICEVGRGIEILIAFLVSYWEKIYCYDQANYKDYLFNFGSINFFQTTSAEFDPSTIPEDIIMIMSHSIYPPFKSNNIIHSIIDGELS